MSIGFQRLPSMCCWCHLNYIDLWLMYNDIYALRIVFVDFHWSQMVFIDRCLIPMYCCWTVLLPSIRRCVVCIAFHIWNIIYLCSSSYTIVEFHRLVFGSDIFPISCVWFPLVSIYLVWCPLVQFYLCRLISIDFHWFVFDLYWCPLMSVWCP